MDLCLWGNMRMDLCLSGRPDAASSEEARKEQVLQSNITEVLNAVLCCTHGKIISWIFRQKNRQVWMVMPQKLEAPHVLTNFTDYLSWHSRSSITRLKISFITLRHIRRGSQFPALKLLPEPVCLPSHAPSEVHNIWQKWRFHYTKICDNYSPNLRHSLLTKRKGGGVRSTLLLGELICRNVSSRFLNFIIWSLPLHYKAKCICINYVFRRFLWSCILQCCNCLLLFHIILCLSWRFREIQTHICFQKKWVHVFLHFANGNWGFRPYICRTMPKGTMFKWLGQSRVSISILCQFEIAKAHFFLFLSGRTRRATCPQKNREECFARYYYFSAFHRRHLNA